MWVDWEGTVDKILIEGGNGGEEIGYVFDEKFLLIGFGIWAELWEFVENVCFGEFQWFNVLVFGHEVTEYLLLY